MAIPKDPLDGRSFYTVLARWRGEVRPFTVEHVLIQTEDEAIDVLTEHPNAFLVLRHDPDIARQDVSEDIARQWLDRLRASGYGPDDTVPQFIGLFLTDEEINRVPYGMAA
jgi:hypothetical protein